MKGTVIVYAKHGWCRHERNANRVLVQAADAIGFSPKEIRRLVVVLERSGPEDWSGSSDGRVEVYWPKGILVGKPVRCDGICTLAVPIGRLDFLLHAAIHEFSHLADIDDYYHDHHSEEYWEVVAEAARKCGCVEQPGLSPSNR